MADDGTKPAEAAELPKDVLAPAEGPRENLVATAVKFLQNPKVRPSPLSQKKAFLERKGLTSEEIELAVQRAGVADDTSSSQTVQLPPQPQYPAAYANTALVPAHQPLPLPPPVSPWTKARELVTTAAIVAAVSYAIYNVFKTYIQPWLMGKSEMETRLERLETNIAQLHASVTDTNAQMVDTLKVIQESLMVQNDRSAQNSEVSLRQESRALGEIKSEVSSLKALLLSRRQFPPPPSTSPIIPTWQKTVSRDDETQQSLTGQTEGATSQGADPATATQHNTAPSSDSSVEKANPSSEDSAHSLQSGKGDDAISQSASSNNEFEMVKPSSDSDTPPDLD